MLSLMSGLCSLLKSILRSQTPPSGGSVTPASPPASSPASSGRMVSVSVAWGARVSPDFRETVIEICSGLGADPNHLMACMAFETGRTFRPDIENGAGSGAVGLIQFMPATAKGLGTSTAALKLMTAVDQLDWVRMYFKPYAGRLKTLSDCYMAILYPAAIGKPEDYVLFSEPFKAYTQNRGLDANLDGHATKAEATAKVQTMLAEGLKEGNVWRG